MLISANRSETEGWRIDRLKKALGFFCSVYGISEKQADLLIDKIHDHKGSLTVTWAHGIAPTPEQARAWTLAWEFSGEHPDSVHHNQTTFA
jgi:hypothetical protein